MDAKRAEVMPILARPTAQTRPTKWWVYWRVFFMSCAELWGYPRGARMARLALPVREALGSSHDEMRVTHGSPQPDRRLLAAAVQLAGGRRHAMPIARRSTRVPRRIRCAATTGSAAARGTPGHAHRRAVRRRQPGAGQSAHQSRHGALSAARTIRRRRRTTSAASRSWKPPRATPTGSCCARCMASAPRISPRGIRGRARRAEARHRPQPQSRWAVQRRAAARSSSR